MSVFVEAAFTHQTLSEYTAVDTWKDLSTSDFFVFTSDFGVVRLCKRTRPPTTFAYIEGSYLHFGYGNPTVGKAIAVQSLNRVPESDFYGEEFLYIVADCTKREVTIQRDALSTLPLFASMDSGKIIVTNAYERVLEIIGQQDLKINDYALAMQLLGIVIGETIFKNIVTLNDRVRINWHNGISKRQLPADGSILTIEKERQNRPSDPKEFFERLEYTLQTYWERYATGSTPGAELSCGLDSSTIVGYYALHEQPLLPATLTYISSERQHLLNRLMEFEQRFSITSLRVAMDPQQDFPLAHKLVPNSNTNSMSMLPFYTEEEIYMKSAGIMSQYFRSTGTSTVFRGSGGDELFENLPLMRKNRTQDSLISKKHIIPAYMTPKFYEYMQHVAIDAPRKPIPLVSHSVATAGLSASNVYIDQGIWPVLPLADPSLYLYCQALPIRFRSNRNILRAYLHARGFPESIYQPARNEDFGSFFAAAATEKISKMFNAHMNQSILATMGLIDSDQAKRMWETALQNNYYDDLYKLYCLLKVEINLQQWKGCSPALVF